MLYFKKTTDAQIVRIPASGQKTDGTVTLRMVNTINRGEAHVFSFDQAVYLVDADGAYVHDADDRQVAVAAVADTSRLYYVLNVALTDDMPEGEYEYTATAGGEVVSCGLAVVGEPKPGTVKYANTVHYEQYRN